MEKLISHMAPRWGLSPEIVAIMADVKTLAEKYRYPILKAYASRGGGETGVKITLMFETPADPANDFSDDPKRIGQRSVSLRLRLSGENADDHQFRHDAVPYDGTAWKWISHREKAYRAYTPAAIEDFFVTTLPDYIAEMIRRQNAPSLA